MNAVVGVTAYFAVLWPASETYMITISTPRSGVVNGNKDLNMLNQKKIKRIIYKL